MKNTESNACTCEASETSTARAVQYSRRRATGRVSVSAAAKRAERSGVTGTPGLVQPPPEGRDQRREVELDDDTRLSSPAARTTSWSSPYLSTEPSVRSIVAASSVSTPSSSSAASQSIASAIPGGFCMSRVAHPCHRADDRDRERLRGALYAPAHDLQLALGVG